MGNVIASGASVVALALIASADRANPLAFSGFLHKRLQARRIGLDFLPPYKRTVEVDGYIGAHLLDRLPALRRDVSQRLLVRAVSPFGYQLPQLRVLVAREGTPILSFEEIFQAAALVGVENVLFLVPRSSHVWPVRICTSGPHDEDVIEPNAQYTRGRRYNLQIRSAHAVGARQAVKRAYIHRQPEARGDSSLQIAHSQVLILKHVAQTQVYSYAHRQPPRRALSRAPLPQYSA